MQDEELEKPIILKKTFCTMDNPLIFLVLIPYILFGWIRVSHLPTVALYWAMGSFCFILLIATFYQEYLILKKEGVSLIKGLY